MSTLSTAVPANPFEQLDTYPVAEIPDATTVQALLAAAHCVLPDTWPVPFPAVPAGGIPAHMLDLIEIEIDESLSLEEFRHALAKTGHRPADALSVLRLCAVRAVCDRRWPPVLCFLEDDQCPLLEFAPLAGKIYVSPFDLSEGIDGHFMLFAVPK